MDERRSSLLPVTVVVLITFGLIATYVTVYFQRAFVTQMTNGHVKEYGTNVEARAFVPAAHVESLITGEYVRTSGPNHWDWEESWK